MSGRKVGVYETQGQGEMKSENIREILTPLMGPCVAMIQIKVRLVRAE